MWSIEPQICRATWLFNLFHLYILSHILDCYMVKPHSHLFSLLLKMPKGSITFFLHFLSPKEVRNSSERIAYLVSLECLVICCIYECNSIYRILQIKDFSKATLALWVLQSLVSWIISVWLMVSWLVGHLLVTSCSVPLGDFSTGALSFVSRKINYQEYNLQNLSGSCSPTSFAPLWHLMPFGISWLFATFLPRAPPNLLLSLPSIQTYTMPFSMRLSIR